MNNKNYSEIHWAHTALISIRGEVEKQKKTPKQLKPNKNEEQ